MQGRALAIGIVTSKRTEGMRELVPGSLRRSATECLRVVRPGDAFAKAGLEYVPVAEAISFDGADGKIQTKSVTLSLTPNFERYNESVVLKLALASDTSPLALTLARSEVCIRARSQACLDSGRARRRVRAGYHVPRWSGMLLSC